VLTREPDGSFALHAPGGGSASTKVFDGASDGGDTYALSPAPHGSVLVWVDGLLETDYSVAFALASESTFAAGDRLTVLAPGSQEARLAAISITFKGTRS
jgi:hypothetical protein